MIVELTFTFAMIHLTLMNHNSLVMTTFVSGATNCFLTSHIAHV